jgi:uncharacterized protein YecT (DUF1311 family)
MIRSQRLLVPLSLAAVLVAVAVGSYKVGENRRSGAGPNGSATASGARTTPQAPVTWPSIGPACAGNQFQLNRCAQRTVKNEQRLLLTVLEDVRSHLDSADERTAFAIAQQRWSAYVDGFCAAINGGDGGSITPMLAANCKAVLTHQRIIDVCQWAVPASDLAGIVNPPEACRRYHT